MALKPLATLRLLSPPTFFMTMRVIVSSPISPLLLEADGQGLARAYIIKEEERHFLAGSGEENFTPLAWSHITAAVVWLNAYFSHQPLPPMPALHMKGTPFQKRVWNALRSIPYGHTTTYGAIARQIGKPKATQAVGQAVGANPVAIIVPCHRVVAANGLGGYAYGLDAKCSLLAIEGCLLI